MKTLHFMDREYLLKTSRKMVLLLFVLVILSMCFTQLACERNETSDAQKTKDEVVEKIETIKSILQDYKKSHTYSSFDLFVCVDMSIEVWNILRTKNYNAKLVVGNVKKNIYNSTIEYFLNEMNHVWILVELDSFVWIPLDVTSCEFIYNQTNRNLYYNGLYFDNPRQLKQFEKLREKRFDVCTKYDETARGWNKIMSGKYKTLKGSEIKGAMDQMGRECEELTKELLFYINNYLHHSQEN